MTPAPPPILAAPSWLPPAGGRAARLGAVLGGAAVWQAAEARGRARLTDRQGLEAVHRLALWRRTNGSGCPRLAKLAAAVCALHAAAHQGWGLDNTDRA